MKTRLLGIIGLVMVGSASLSMGGAQLPYSNDFETNSVGSSITTDPSWTAASSAVTVISNVSYLDTAVMNTPYMGSPLRSSTHAKVLSFSDGYLTNSYSDTGDKPFIAIDTMILPTFSQQDWTNSTDSAVSNSQFSIAFVTNGVAVWHGVKTNSSDIYGADYKLWSVLNNAVTPVSSGKWVRLTISVDYNAEPSLYGSYYAMFQVKLDGRPLILADGYPSNRVDSSATGGSWLLTSWGQSPTFISSLTLNGSGMIDDLVVTNGPIANSITPNYFVPAGWLASHGVTNDTSDNALTTAEVADTDGDGMKNWQEYFAGTEPTNAASKLAFISEVVSNNSIATLQWQGSSKALAPYTVQVSTNLSFGWSNVVTLAVGGDVTRTVTTSAPGSPAFYRVSVIK